MSENILLGYVIGNKENIDGGWKAKILGIRALVLPEFKEVTCDIKELSPKQLEFFGADSGNIENITDINFIYRRLSSEDCDSFFFEVNYSNRYCSLKCLIYEFCNYNIIYDKDCKPLHYILVINYRKSEGALELQHVEGHNLSIVITISNANYEFDLIAYYIPKIGGYTLGIKGANSFKLLNYYCIGNKEVDYITWGIAKKDVRLSVSDYIEIWIDNGIASQYLTDIGEYTIFNNVYLLNYKKVNCDTLIIPKDCKNFYCERYGLSKFKSIVIPPNLDRFWYWLTINIYNDEHMGDDTRNHKDTKFYFSKTAPASQLYMILCDLIADYYHKCAKRMCEYEKCDNKLENVKTVEDVLEVLYDATDYINIELY